MNFQLLSLRVRIRTRCEEFNLQEGHEQLEKLIVAMEESSKRFSDIDQKL